jgi:hypothetical protein
MDVMVGLAAVLLAITGLAVLLLRSMQKESRRVHARLDEFADRANSSKTIEELEKTYTELFEYAEKECSYNGYYERVAKIMTYIRGKYAGLKLNPPTPII